jgi:hypothetical protein
MRHRLLLLCCALLAAVPARADERLAFLTRQLERAKDPRLRAQSALMLGASDDGAAVTPLCAALSDGQGLVRSAAAKALGELAEPAAIDCLKKAQRDPEASVQEAVKQAVETLVTVKNRKPTLYIALGEVTDKSRALDGDLLRYVEERLKAKLRRMGGVVAPASESKQTARQVIRARKLKGFYLRPELQMTSSGALRLSLVCFTYPEQALLGEVDVKGKGGRPNEIIRALAPKVLEEAADTFEWSP